MKLYFRTKSNIFCTEFAHNSSSLNVMCKKERRKDMLNHIIDKVICNRYLLSLILKHLPRREALRTSLVCSNFHEAVHLLQIYDFRPRLLLGCSRLSKVLDIDLSTNQVNRMGQHIAPKRRSHASLSRGSAPNWITGIAINPSDGDLYVCQYKVKGVLRFCGLTLKYKHIAVQHLDLEYPEGIAFGHERMYVQNNWGKVVSLKKTVRAKKNPMSSGYNNSPEQSKVLSNCHLEEEDVSNPPRLKSLSSQEGPGSSIPATCKTQRQSWLSWSVDHSIDLGPMLVTWGLCFHQGDLYSAVDRFYESHIYTIPPSGPATGSVYQIRTDNEGRLGLASVFTKSAIRRPSGLRFDTFGRLWVTSMEVEAGLMCFSGLPCQDAGSLLLSIAVEPSGYFPWDIVVLPKPDVCDMHDSKSCDLQTITPLKEACADTATMRRLSQDDQQALRSDDLIAERLDPEAGGSLSGCTSSCNSKHTQLLANGADRGEYSKVRLVTSLHRNKSLRSTKKEGDKQCWLTSIDVGFSHFSCCGMVTGVQVHQVPSSLPEYVDHSNMMCLDL
ncbi:hypothetical protein CEUSTIGMA_g8738.t1 [Chlamydomonas eustigma]|uniref:F-box domain-containing protein n=1 Tax=Chlamydomonas eustigma TaxID=1157962 RepID=A0A250XDZ5_9CHLO|nr:hypothetical protein CEUSTIGMA_g8738.t1 [Chlamydomonas eustigma]|eukprot:GAX81307.1 hypothetical protein CEUSTIGMA_g8738.t1 [Chlamydomonas eustigma]